MAKALLGHVGGLDPRIVSRCAAYSSECETWKPAGAAPGRESRTRPPKDRPTNLLVADREREPALT